MANRARTHNWLPVGVGRTCTLTASGRLSLATGTLSNLDPVRPRSRRRRTTVIVALLVVLALVVAGLTAARAVLFPRVDSADRVDAIVVVAGAQDDRYIYARHLAEEGAADHILVSQPSGSSGPYATALNSYCATTPITARDGGASTSNALPPTSIPPRARPRRRPASPENAGTGHYWW